jgi:exonuclease III
MNKRKDGTFVSNLKSFQDFFYAENLDIVSVTETWLNDNVSDNEILPSGYNIIRKDRPPNKRGGGVLSALRNGIQYNNDNVLSGTWSDHLEILAIELLTAKPNKCLLCVCYRPPNSDLNDWLDLFTSFLQVAEKYEKILITGDFNFPDLIWNCDNASQTLSSSSIQF